jgi:hypothetical protein
VSSLSPIPMPRLKLSARQALARWEDQIKDAVRSRWDYLMNDPVRRRKTLLWSKISAPFLVLLLAGLGWWIWGPRLQPDYDRGAIDDVFDYTLLSDEFNRLPVEERLKLIGKLVQRMKGLSTDDSVLLAAFAAGIGGAAREQLERNAARMAIDLWDSYAKDYGKVPLEKQGEYLEEKFVEFSKTMEEVAGEHRDVSDRERVDEMKKQAQKDMKWAKEHPDRMPNGRELGTVFSVLNYNVGGHASPEQRARGSLLMRDMIRQFRGQDPSTGKWKNGPP